MTLDDLQKRAAGSLQRIAFPDSIDVRTLKAVVRLKSTGLCDPILVGDATEINNAASQANIDISSVQITDVSEHLDGATAHIIERRKHKGITQEEAESFARTPLYAAGYLVSAGIVDGAMAGSTSTTADVLRAAITTVGTAEGTNTVSSYFLMIWPDGRAMTYSDCGVVPSPTADQLVDIAHDASTNHAVITGDTPRVAFLSFATKGSAEHESLHGIRASAASFAAKYPNVISDGELQGDAALVPEVAAKKAPQSPVAGKANVLIFPDLNAGNIAYKLTERLSGATALGPIIQGLAKPYCDLSRGCSVDDIINVACITSIMAANAS